MHVQRMADRHNRGIAQLRPSARRSPVRISITRSLPESMGVYGEGPITDPKDLGPAIRKRAIEVVKRGEPALVDVVTSTRDNENGGPQTRRCA